MPSFSEKPTAKSSRSEGVAIITACVTPLKESATGVSSASMRRPEPARPARRNCISKDRSDSGDIGLLGRFRVNDAARLPACSSYSTCHSVGPFDGVTCTAVTLYSGQFVAQSE
jgi:hypothetical protein